MVFSQEKSFAGLESQAVKNTGPPTLTQQHQSMEPIRKSSELESEKEGSANIKFNIKMILN